MKGRKKGSPPPPPDDLRRDGPPDKGCSLIWGRRPVCEALTGPLPPLRIIVQEGATGPVVADIRRQAARRGIPLQQMGRARADALVPGENHQGVLAYIPPFRYGDLEELLQKTRSSPLPPCLLILDHLQDPHNLGSLLRTAAAAGIDGVIIPRDRACGITPVVYKTSAGTAFNLPVVRVVNIAREIDRLKAEGFWVAGAEMAEARPFYKADLTFPLALVLGGEGKGLSRLVKKKCDLLLRIPMAPEVQSLNVSVAGGILIYEIYRRRSRR